MTELHTVLVDHVRRDLAAFGDPATLVDIIASDDGRSFNAEWTQDGRRRSAIFETGEPEDTVPAAVSTEMGAAMTYAGFLSGPSMANLRMLARNAVNVILDSPNYVPPTALAGAEEEESTGRPADVLIDELARSVDDRTSVVFIAAEAGVGKTTLLRHLARLKAQQYLDGASDVLWLYVDAQGRRLAQLDEAVAAELDDLRAKFPYHAISSLVRSGAVVLAIDGFDELIGSVGSYEEAFGSLAAFITDLHGGGCLVAAARSSYYEQEFLSRANATRGLSANGWVLRPVKLLDWSPAQREAYVSAAVGAGASPAERRLLVDQVLEVLDAPDVGDLGFKPLFVSRTLDVVAGGHLVDGPTLLDRLISAYVLRETSQKLRSPVSGDPMISADDFRTLLSEIAEEMWKQESRELSVASVREVGELVGELVGLSGDSLSEVVQRLPHAALLAQGSTSGSVTFEHDVFFSYFLAGPITRAWQRMDGRSLAMLLRRGRLAEEAASLAGRLARSERGVQELLEVLAEAGEARRIDVAQIRRNAGGLAAALMQGADLSGLTVKNIDFTDVSIAGLTLRGSELRSCTFGGTDLSSVRFLECAGTGLTFERVLVDPGFTRMEFEGVGTQSFFSLTVRRDSNTRTLFSPDDVAVTLRECGLPAARGSRRTRAISEPALALLNRLCSLYSKTNAVTELDDEMRYIVGSPEWRALRDAMHEAQVVTFEKKSASGQKVFLHRHFRPQDIMMGLDVDASVPAEIRAFWDLIEAQRI